MIVSVSPEADRELSEDALYYAREGGAEVGLAFITEYERAIALPATHPELGARWGNRRRFPMRKFPYSVIYYIHGDQLRVIALAHQQRKPDYWAGRK